MKINNYFYVVYKDKKYTCVVNSISDEHFSSLSF